MRKVVPYFILYKSIFYLEFLGYRRAIFGLNQFQPNLKCTVHWTGPGQQAQYGRFIFPRAGPSAAPRTGPPLSALPLGEGDVRAPPARATASSRARRCRHLLVPTRAPSAALLF
jgi:hypothetical protein